MDVSSLLRKEVLWSKHNLLVLALIFLLLPAIFGTLTVGFQYVLPEDIPVGIVAQDGTTENDVDIVKGGITEFMDPRVYDSRDVALDDLRRERVYAVIDVPPLPDGEIEDRVTFRFYVHGSIAPFLEASKAIANILNFYLDQQISPLIDVERSVVGTERTLGAYLVPAFTVGFTFFLAMAYLPHVVATESETLERLRVDTGMRTLLLTKIGYFSLLLGIPLGVFAWISGYLGYDLSVFAPMTLLTLWATFVSTGAIATGVMVMAKFRTIGRFVNLLLLFGVNLFSGLAYPLGYFSGLRRTLTQLNPLYEATVMVRSGMLKGLGFDLFTHHAQVVAGLFVASLVFLELSITVYKRRV